MWKFAELLDWKGLYLALDHDRHRGLPALVPVGPQPKTKGLRKGHQRLLMANVPGPGRTLEATDRFGEKGLRHPEHNVGEKDAEQDRRKKDYPSLFPIQHALHHPLASGDDLSEKVRH